MYFKVILDSPVTNNMRFIDTHNNTYNVNRSDYKFLKVHDVFEGKINFNKIVVMNVLTDDDDIVTFKAMIPYKGNNNA